MKSTFVFALVFAALATTATAQDARVPIYITSEASASGFTDPSKDRNASLGNIQDKLRESKIFQLVDSRETATVVIEVLSRETKDERNGWSALNAGLGGYGQKQNKSSVTVRLTAGEFSSEFSGTSNSRGMFTGYKDAAKKVVKQLETWASANRAKL